MKTAVSVLVVSFVVLILIITSFKNKCEGKINKHKSEPEDGELAP